MSFLGPPPPPVVAIDKEYRNDAKSVAIVALGCLHPATKVQSACLHFFLGSDEESENSDESDDDVRSCFINKIISSIHL